MISDLTLRKKIYVDGTPSEGQMRIGWLLNGERPCGAETKYDHGGSLNRPGVHINTNLDIAFDNADVTADKVNVIINQVNEIKENLGVISSGSIVQKINDLSDASDKHETQIEVIASDIIYVNNAIDDLRANTGEWDPAEDNTFRTLRDDDLFLKKELGNYDGFDFNGNIAQGNASSGVKGRVMAAIGGVKQNELRIDRLEKSWEDSDVGKVVIALEQQRKEIGPTSMATSQNIYERFDSVVAEQTRQSSEMAELKINIGYDSANPIKERLSRVETNYQIMDQKLSGPYGIERRLQDVELIVGEADDPGSLVSDNNLNKKNITSLQTIVGITGSDGLQGSVAELNTTVGIGDPTNTSKMYGKLEANVRQTGLNTQDLVGIKETLNGSPTQGGVVPAMNKIIMDFYGNDPANSQPLPNDVPVREAVRELMKGHDDQYVSDVPKDGLNYVRTNGQWVQIPIAAGRFQAETAFNIDLSADNPHIISTTALKAADWTRQISVQNNSQLSIADQGPLKFEVDARIGSDLADKKIELQIYVNGTRHQEDEFTSIVGSTGSLLLSLNTVINIPKSAVVEFYLYSPEYNGVVDIQNLTCTVQPI
ncbi:fibritin neck whiskers [Serratia phage PS2]|uniref:Fibritin neck whiskers n=1 Tax=Serratia phage PS2 TaxID=1481112 RepID=A0A023W569_9CAUD|nr:fibritin neck whisker [Serratia phage PS2]AHY25415.1 fibritin neck whiskers [Serratia phage PS2]